MVYIYTYVYIDISHRLGKPVLNLNYLLDTIMQRVKPLDWDVFWDKQKNKKIILKVVASGLISKVCRTMFDIKNIRYIAIVVIITLID